MRSRAPGGWLLVHLEHTPDEMPFWPTLQAVSATDWQRVLPQLLDPPQGAAWPRFKADHSGEVVGGVVTLNGVDVTIVIKHPLRTRAGQAIADAVRHSRARRAWCKTWRLIKRGLPTELPLLLAERGRFGIVRDQFAVYARVPGELVRDMDLAQLTPAERLGLFRGVGELLRRINGLGYAHRDAKTSNWMAVRTDEGLQPVLLDCDGVRRDPLRRRPTAGINRFLRALREHPQATEGDHSAVEAGFLVPT